MRHRMRKNWPDLRRGSCGWAARRLRLNPAGRRKPHFARALVDGDAAFTGAIQQAVAALEGPIVPVLTPADGDAMLVGEVSLSINTTAAGGNASLMVMA